MPQLTLVTKQAQKRLRLVLFVGQVGAPEGYFPGLANRRQGDPRVPQSVGIHNKRCHVGGRYTAFISESVIHVERQVTKLPTGWMYWVPTSDLPFRGVRQFIVGVVSAALVHELVMVRVQQPHSG